MNTFKEFLLESKEIFYRGLDQSWSDDYAKKQHIIFVTSDKNYAMSYAKDEDHLISFHVNFENAFEFGFRTLTTQVKLEEVLSRIKSGVLKQFENGKITKTQGLKLCDDLAKLNISGHKRVHEWYMQVPELCEILKNAGFDSIKCDEGLKNDIVTYGLFSVKQMTKIISSNNQQ